jgi:hypothetical protein
MSDAISKAIELLQVASCPCCDGSGAYSDNHGGVCQCQFCYEREEAISALQALQSGEPVAHIVEGYDGGAPYIARLAHPLPPVGTKLYTAPQHSGEPVAWCFTDVNGKPKELVDHPKYKSEQDMRIYTPLYTTPQAVVPELTGKQWSAMRDKFIFYATKFRDADHSEIASACADAAPVGIYKALLSAGKENNNG